MVVLRRREGGDVPQYNEDEELLERRRWVLQSLNWPEDYDMLSPQAQRAARERADKEALAGLQIRWVGPQEMPLAAEAPFQCCLFTGNGSQRNAAADPEKMQSGIYR